MVNTIIFYAEVSGGCEHTNTTLEEGDLVSHYYVCDDCGNVATMEEHDYELIEEIDSSCTEWGSKVYECATCGKDKEDPIVKKLHNYENGACTMCEITNPVFDFGANGALTHKDGDEVSKYTETVNDFTLELTGLSKAYTKAYDAFGNSCLKLGTSSVIATFSFTVPNNVDEVIIAAAKYKSNTSKLDINGTQKELTKNSDAGEYELISIDTTETKTITVKTVTGACRAMINSITFVVNNEAEEECTHTNTTTTNTATYFKAGVETVVCDDCEETISETAVNASNVALKGDITTAYADGKLTISWTYSDALVLDIIDGAKISFNYSIAGYSNTVAVEGQTGSSIVLEGFNLDRLNADLTFNLSADVDTANKLSAATATTVKASAIANDAELSALVNALNAENAETEVNGTVADTTWLVSNTAKLDLKAGTAELKIAASELLVNYLKGIEKTGRVAKLTVKVGDITETFTLETLYKVTIINISGLSFEHLNGEMSAQLAVEYPDSTKNVTTHKIVFDCGDIIANADTDVANAFDAYMN